MRARYGDGHGETGSSGGAGSATSHHPARESPSQTFFCEGDYEAYVQLLAEWCGREGVEVWACCLMPNNVHLIAVPESAESLRRALAEAHFLARLEPALSGELRPQKRGPQGPWKHGCSD